MDMDTLSRLASRWRNPSDILSLLLIIGGDIVQRAIAQLFGVSVRPWMEGPRIYLTPVAFSFGWVGYAFLSVGALMGDVQLMPPQPDCPSKAINCKTGYARVNSSWVLGRLLRDHERRAQRNTRTAHSNLNSRPSLTIDLFKLETPGLGPRIDSVWLMGWLTIITQLAISVVPWILYGDWVIFVITASGTAFALLTGSLRQWGSEKWAARRLNKPGSVKDATKTVCLTRGNGHRHAMVLIGSGGAFDLENMATATSESATETPWVLGLLAVLWTCLLISVSGLEQNTWFLVGIGALGMMQNLYASVAHRSPEALNMKLTPWAERATIIGLGFHLPFDDEDSDEDMKDDTWRQPMDLQSTPGVRGAIRELEKIIPRAGMSLMPEFFPMVMKYERGRYRTNIEKKFWKQAFREAGIPIDAGNGDGKVSAPSIKTPASQRVTEIVAHVPD